jgi:hypothetical protein
LRHRSDVFPRSPFWIIIRVFLPRSANVAEHPLVRDPGVPSLSIDVPRKAAPGTR